MKKLLLVLALVSVGSVMARQYGTQRLMPGCGTYLMNCKQCEVENGILYCACGNKDGSTGNYSLVLPQNWSNKTCVCFDKDKGLKTCGEVNYLPGSR